MELQGCVVNNQIEFLKELKALLEKHEAEISLHEFGDLISYFDIFEISFKNNHSCFIEGSINGRDCDELGLKLSKDSETFICLDAAIKILEDQNQ